MKNAIAVTVLSALVCFSARAAYCSPREVLSTPDAVKALIRKGEEGWRAEVGRKQASTSFCEQRRARTVLPTRPSNPPKSSITCNAIGDQGTVAYVIRTSDGLLMIDSLSPGDTQTKLLPGFQKLGLDPAMVKIIVIGQRSRRITSAGAPYFQEHFGSKIYTARTPIGR